MLVVTDSRELDRITRFAAGARWRDLDSAQAPGFLVMDCIFGPQQDKLVRDLDVALIDSGAWLEEERLVTAARGLARVGNQLLIDPIGDGLLDGVRLQ